MWIIWALALQFLFIWGVSLYWKLCTEYVCQICQREKAHEIQLLLQLVLLFLCLLLLLLPLHSQLKLSRSSHKQAFCIRVTYQPHSDFRCGAWWICSWTWHLLNRDMGFGLKSVANELRIGTHIGIQLMTLQLTQWHTRSTLLNTRKGVKTLLTWQWHPLKYNHRHIVQVKLGIVFTNILQPFLLANAPQIRD